MKLNYEILSFEINQVRYNWIICIKINNNNENLV